MQTEIGFMNIVRSINNHSKIIIRDIVNEPLNKGKKIQFLRKYLMWQLFQKRKKSYIIKFENGLKSIVRPVPDNDAGEIGIWTRNMDYYDTQFVRSILHKGDYIVDAGCNVGNRTLALADLLGGALLIDAGRVAVARTREHLALNKLSPDHFIVLNMAVGEKVGIVRFTDAGGASTLNRVIEEGVPYERTIEVEMTTIDKEVRLWGESPAFIKIDVEGQDLNALKGALNTLKNGSVKLVKFERNQSEPLIPIIEFFSEIKWQVFSLDKKGIPSTSGNLISQDMNLFAMPEKIFGQIAINKELVSSTSGT